MTDEPRAERPYQVEVDTMIGNIRAIVNRIRATPWRFDIDVQFTDEIGQDERTNVDPTLTAFHEPKAKKD